MEEPSAVKSATKPKKLKGNTSSSEQSSAPDPSVEEPSAAKSIKSSSSTKGNPTGLIKVLANVYSDEEPESAESTKCNACGRLQKENQELYEKLRKTEAKFLSLADTLESIYSVINPM